MLKTRKPQLFAFLGAAAFALSTGKLSAQIKENLDLPFAAIAEEVEEEEAPEGIAFYGVPLEGDGFFYIIDRSGTMQDAGELARAKQEVLKNLREFSERVYFGIFFFDRDVTRFPPNGQPAMASPGMKAAASSFVQSTPGGGMTCGKEALLQALRMANMCKAKRKVIAYLSDGGATCMDQDPASYRKETLRAVAATNTQRVKINTIAVLSVEPGGEQFLRELSSMSGGTYTRIKR